MTVDVLVLLFPLVLAIHNLDEYLRYEDFIRAFHPRLPAKLTTRAAVFWAATALTAFTALIIPVAVACLLCIGYTIASILTPTGARLRRSASILSQPDRNRHSN